MVVPDRVGFWIPRRLVDAARLDTDERHLLSSLKLADAKTFWQDTWAILPKRCLAIAP